MALGPRSLQTRGGRQVRPELQTEYLPGIYHGLVEFNNDPEQRGRIKVRVFQLHGPPEKNKDEDIPNRTPTEHLPWALPCLPFAGGQDYGTFVIPPVGSTVWVMAAGGKQSFFVYLGGYPTNNTEGKKYLRAMDLPKHEISMAGEKDDWTGTLGPETPLDATEILHAAPEVLVLGKSVKGATIVMRDVDERESLDILDRQGQGLFFEAEVTKAANEKNKTQRKLKNVTRGKTPAKVETETVASETRVMLVDSAGQAVTLHAHKGSERVRVISRPVDDATGYSGHTKEIALDLDAGARKIVLSTSSSTESVTRVVIDPETGHVEISTGGTAVVYSDAMVIKGDLHVDGGLTVEGDSVVLGESIVAGALAGGETNV